jgi:CRP/FNR family cyclic AMP-dependent transcriptional regulator
MEHLAWVNRAEPSAKNLASAFAIKSSKSKFEFDAQALLQSTGVVAKVAKIGRKQTVFDRGEVSDSVMYLQDGHVKISVGSKTGKELVVAILGAGDFFGEACLSGQTHRMASASAITPSTVIIIEKADMIRLLRSKHGFSDHFFAHMMVRNIRVEQELIGQLFSPTEKRLARALLLLARYGMEGSAPWVIPKIPQDSLAEMIGATPARLNLLMRQFKKLGFIKYNGGIEIHGSLLNVALHE